MAKPDINKLQTFLDEKWGERNCPMCDHNSWGLFDSLFQLTELDKDGFVLHRTAIPVIPVTCKNCGYTALINAIIAGFVNQPVPEKKEEPK